MSNSYSLKTLKGDEFLDSSIIFEDEGNFVRLIYQLDNLRLSVEHRYPFFALTKIRNELNELGLKILCKGARKDVYPSGMSAKGIKAYELEYGKSAVNLVNIFDKETDISKIASVFEQKEYRDNWLKSLQY